MCSLNNNENLNMQNDQKDEALKYHSYKKPGKIGLSITKPCTTAEELALAYSPGVAYPCLEIKDNADDAYKYTAKANLVGVISNGTAVLGLGDIGALAGKPVMEGKGVLFKRFANVDVFDIEVDEKDPEKFIETVERIAPTFGGINLEDIKAPECFKIEEELKKRLKIPVFHDDQHGTAIIVAAGLKNALKIVEKRIDEVKIAVNGAGSAAVAISHLLLDVGVKKENLFMLDSKGLIVKSRTDLNEYKNYFAQEADTADLTKVIKDIDVFIGVSKGNVLTAEMVKTMNAKPIIFALANPTPEIDPKTAHEAVPDAIIATGRSDYANQINNVLGFPYIFRAALDVRATEINKEMKLAAVEVIAKLAHEPVPKSVKEAYGQDFVFGPEYIIPKPFDPRLLSEIPPVIAQTAMNTGAARQPINDMTAYKTELTNVAEALGRGNFCYNCTVRKGGLNNII
jgi:malate dehydrogenase (oxaloacetate-decarboxylating)(NADP+)